MTLGRRGLLTGGAGLLLAGCTKEAGATTAPSSSAAPPTSSPTSPTPTPTPRPTPTLPATSAWAADPNEIRGPVKLVVTTMLEAAGTWARPGVEAARGRIAALGVNPALADQLSPLVSGASAAALQVIDAQYGGLLGTSASVLVPTLQYVLGADGTLGQRGWTFDVRLTAASPNWTITEIHPSDPGPAVAVDSLATEVLGSSRIALPPASRADIASGQVHDSVLKAMLALAGTYEIGVSVIRSGHPTYVFGTSRLSDHPRGRAFDTWRINGAPVVSTSTPKTLVTGYMRAVAGLGSYNVGGPYQLSGGQYFSDQTHHDHVHAGFTT